MAYLMLEPERQLPMRYTTDPISVYQFPVGTAFKLRSHGLPVSSGLFQPSICFSRPLLLPFTPWSLWTARRFDLVV